jgi:hypothetical protein
MGDLVIGSGCPRMHLWDVHYLAHMVFSKGAQYPVIYQ